MISNILLNPVVISIILLCILCLCRINVLLAILISSILAGITSHMGITDIMNTFISGMGGNSETALSYILLGAFAAAMNNTGLTDVISQRIIDVVNNRVWVLFLIICLIAMASQNIIPIHIAFIPILIPALLFLGVSSIKLYKSIVKDRRKENIKISILKHSIVSTFILIILIISSLIKIEISYRLIFLFAKYF